jgi:hypothetical protein
MKLINAMKKILFVTILFIHSIQVFGQSEVLSFSLLESPIRNVYLDSLPEDIHDLSTTDSVKVKAYVLINDTTNIDQFFFKIGNDTINQTYSIINDSIGFNNLPYTLNDIKLERKGKRLKFDFGQVEKTDTLYGQFYLKRTDGSFSMIKNFPKEINY